MAKVAKQVLRLNGCGDMITVVPKRFTEMKVGPGMCVLTGTVCCTAHVDVLQVL